MFNKCKYTLEVYNNDGYLPVEIIVYGYIEKDAITTAKSLVNRENYVVKKIEEIN